MAPTFLELAGADGESGGMKKISGKSLVPFIKDNAGRKEKQQRREIILGRERDDYGRPGNQGYPIRAIIKDNYLYIWNMKPYLMPAGNPETGYMDVDGSPTKTQILDMNRRGIEHRFWDMSFGIRPEHELYDLTVDPYCMNNLSDNPLYFNVFMQLSARLKEQLVIQGDPRMGDDGDIFDNYPFDTADKEDFYERVVSGQIQEPWKTTGWINPTDYEIYHENR